MFIARGNSRHFATSPMVSLLERRNSMLMTCQIWVVLLTVEMKGKATLMASWNIGSFIRLLHCLKTQQFAFIWVFRPLMTHPPPKKEFLLIISRNTAYKNIRLKPSWDFLTSQNHLIPLFSSRRRNIKSRKLERTKQNASPQRPRLTVIQILVKGVLK